MAFLSSSLGKFHFGYQMEVNMIKSIKLKVCVLFTVLLVGMAVLISERSISFAEITSNAQSTISRGWKKENNKYVYINSKGKKLVGWNKLNGLMYYFSTKGEMVTGVQVIAGKQHLFADDGVYKGVLSVKTTQNGANYATTGNKTYYYDKKGNKLGTGKKYISNASAYTGDTTTASGQRPRWGTIAVDPKVIPLGSRVYVPYFDKVFIANDTGGIIKGTMIDIFMNSASQMNNFGRRNLEIIVLD